MVMTVTESKSQEENETGEQFSNCYQNSLSLISKAQTALNIPEIDIY
jgi:hypothetical protein